MKRRILVVCGMALAGLAAALLISGSRTVKAQTPDAVIGGNEHDRLLYLGISRTAGGSVDFSEPHRYECNRTGRTLHMIAYVAEGVLRVTSSDCEELSRILNAGMTVRWEVLARELEHGVQSGTLNGSFTWRDEHNTIMGTMEGTLGKGTHRRPIFECETCSMPDHVEGTFRGQFTRGELAGSYVRGSFAGKIIRRPEQSRLYINLDGVYVLPCHHEPAPPPPPGHDH